MKRFSFNSPTLRTLIWFNDDRIERLMERADRRNLSKAGAYVRSDARKSIRKGKKPSAPGRPPHSHVGTLKRLVFFAFDPVRRSVVIGPFATPPRASGPRRRRTYYVDRKTGAETLEKGGRIIRFVPRHQRKRKPRAGRRYTTAQVRRIREEYARRSGYEELVQRTIKIEPRPFMRPALAKNMPKFPKLWADSMRVG